MKILILQDDFPPDSRGGAGNVAFNIAKELSKRGEDVYVVTTTQNKNKEGEAIYNGLKIFRIYSSYNVRWRAYLSLYNPYTIKKLRKIISDFKPDIVHAHNIHFHISYYALKLAKLSGAKVLLTAHDVMLFHYGKLTKYFDPKNTLCFTTTNYKISPWMQFKTYKRRYNPLRNLIIRHYLNYCDNVCAVSIELKKALLQNKIQKVVVVHNGIDTKIWSSKVEGKGLSSRNEVERGETLRSDMNLKDKKIILQVGQPDARKGSDHMIKIMNIVKNTLPNIVLLIAGQSDGYGKRMKEIAKLFNVELIFTGWLGESELQSVYNIADVVVFPSLCFETFGMVNIEAMAMEKPVVATCFGGPKEIVEDGATGYIRNPYDTNSFAQAVAELLQSTEKAKEFGKNGRVRVEKNFTLDKQVNKYIDIYNK